MKKWISVLLTLAMLASIAVMGVTSVSAESEGIRISVDKTTFAIGEDIEVHYTGLDESYKSKDLELRMDLRGDTSVSSKDYINLTVGEGTEPADVYRGAEGTVSFEDEGYRKAFPYSAGTYTLCVMQYAPTRTVISNTITITVMASELSLSKTNFVSGESIDVSFTSMTGYAGSEIRIDSGWDLDELTYTKNRSSFPASKWCDPVANHLDTCSVSYASDVDRKGAAIAPGKYTLWIMDYTNNTIISNKIEFKITAAPITNVSVNKTEFVEGEPIEVSFTGFTGYADAEIRIDSGHDMDPDYFPSHRVASTDYVLCSDFMSTGKVTFPTDGKRNVTAIPEGKYTIWVMSYEPLGIISNQIEITVGKVPDPAEVSLESTTIPEGESVSFDFKNISEYLGPNVELRVYTVDKQTVGQDPSVMYFKLTDAQGAPTRGEKGNVTFPADDARGNTTIPAGDYVAILLDGENHQLADKIEFKVQAEKVPDPAEFSLKSTTIPEGESVTFDFKNISENLGPNVELRIYTVDKQAIGKDPSAMYFKLTDAQGALTRGENGNVTFPADDARGNTILPAGDYVAFLLDGQNHQIGDKIEFKVQGEKVPDPAEFSLKSTTIPEGESVTFDFKNISENLGPNVELRIYTVDKQAIGKDPSAMYFKLTDAQGVLTRGENGNVTFPADDARGNTILPAGDYVAFLLDGQNHQIGDKIEFKVQSDNVSTGDFGQLAFAALVIVMAGSLVVIKKKKEVYGK